MAMTVRKSTITTIYNSFEMLWFRLKDNLHNVLLEDKMMSQNCQVYKQQTKGKPVCLCKYIVSSFKRRNNFTKCTQHFEKLFRQAFLPVQTSYQHL